MTATVIDIDDRDVAYFAVRVAPGLGSICCHCRRQQRADDGVQVCHMAATIPICRTCAAELAPDLTERLWPKAAPR